MDNALALLTNSDDEFATTPRGSASGGSLSTRPYSKAGTTAATGVRSASFPCF